MSSIEWKLKDLLEQEGLTAYALVKGMGVGVRANTIYRLARRENLPTRVDLETVRTIIDTLNCLTGKKITVCDIIKYYE